MYLLIVADELPDQIRALQNAPLSTAPIWYRPLLKLEGLAIDIAFRERQLNSAETLRERQAEDGGERSEDGTVWAINRIGGLSSERAAPGEADGWLMAQHVSRYAWAMPWADRKRVIELGSGAGYGSFVLSWVAESVRGIEIDPIAVDLAKSRYEAMSDGLEYSVGDICVPENLPEADVAVCFEVLEHVEDPERVLQTALERCETLLLSFPNPLYAGSHLTPHHRVDWPLVELKRQLRRAGAREIEVFNQGFRSASVRSRGAWRSAIWVLAAHR